MADVAVHRLLHRSGLFEAFTETIELSDAGDDRSLPMSAPPLSWFACPFAQSGNVDRRAPLCLHSNGQTATECILYLPVSHSGSQPLKLRIQIEHGSNLRHRQRKIKSKAAASRPSEPRYIPSRHTDTHLRAERAGPDRARLHSSCPAPGAGSRHAGGEGGSDAALLFSILPFNWSGCAVLN